MQIYLSIDDTDNLESPGSGQLSEMMARELKAQGLVAQSSPITRHQLFVHESIPYTSHNSSMCFTADIHVNRLDDVIRFAGDFLRKESASGSDPGLCVAAARESLDRQALIDFGLQAKKTIFTKQDAYSLAHKTGIHLSEHGGTGDGVVGALAGIGLRLQGSDGRIRGWLQLGPAGRLTSPAQLCSLSLAEAVVVDDEGRVVPEDASITIAENKIKTVFLNHRQVIPVTRDRKSEMPAWVTLTKSQVKRF